MIRNLEDRPLYMCDKLVFAELQDYFYDYIGNETSADNSNSLTLEVLYCKIWFGTVI